MFCSDGNELRNHATLFESIRFSEFTKFNLIFNLDNKLMFQGSLQSWWKMKNTSTDDDSTQSHAHLYNASYPIIYCMACYNRDEDMQLIDLIESYSQSALGCDNQSSCSSIAIDIVYDLDTNSSYPIVFSLLMSNRYSLHSEVSYFCVKHGISNDACNLFTTQVVLMGSRLIQSLFYEFPSPWRTEPKQVVLIGDTNSVIFIRLLDILIGRGISVVGELDELDDYPCMFIVSTRDEPNSIPCSCIIVFEVRMT